MKFSMPEFSRGQPFPSPGDLPNPGIEPRSPALQADSLPAELQGKPLESRTKIQMEAHILNVYICIDHQSSGQLVQENLFHPPTLRNIPSK